ncbi:MAG: hypothetical protein ACMUJM_24260 [bacterium]
MLSDVIAAEITQTPDQVRNLHAELIELAEILPVTEEVLELLFVYESRSVLSSRFRNDMLHISLATIAEVDIFVSWNFKHIVRLDKIQLFNGINLELGYKTLIIYSPLEVTTYGRD